jgi:hypothetical protein
MNSSYYTLLVAQGDAQYTSELIDNLSLATFPFFLILLLLLLWLEANEVH